MNFDIRKIEDTSNILIIGRRATGKSTLVKNIITTKPTKTIIISPSIEYHNPYSEIPNVTYYNTLDNIENILEQNITIVLDDALFNTRDYNKINELLYKGRHYNIRVIITLQYPSIPPAIRANFDYIFLFQENQFRTKMTLYEHYGKIFPTYDVFVDTFNKITKDSSSYTSNTSNTSNTSYTSMVINNRTQSNRIEDKIGSYKVNLYYNLRPRKPVQITF